MVMPFIYLPFTVGSALVVNLIPSISQEMELCRFKNAFKKIYYSLLLTFIVGICFSIFFYFFADKLCLIVFNNKLAGTYLKSMYLVPLFMSLNQTLSGILHAIKKEVPSSIITISTMLLQIILLYFLLPIPTINIYAYIYTMKFISILAFLLNVIVLIKALKKFKK